VLASTARYGCPIKFGELTLAIKGFENAREVLGKMYWSDHPTLALLDRHLAYAKRLETDSKTAPGSTPEPPDPLAT
jgi:hypothetical protein